MIMRALALLLTMAITVPAFAQRGRANRPKPPAQGAKPSTAAWPIGSLAVQGNRHYPAEQILRVTGLRVGQSAGRPEFDAARDRLLATGLFDNVNYRFGPSAADPKKFAATFEVTEIAQTYPYRFEELGVEREGLEKWLSSHEAIFASRIPATEQVLSRYAAHIGEYLAKHGKPAKVTGRLSPMENDLAIVFRPANLPSVAEIRFTGNKAFDTVTLQRTIASTGIGAVYTERRFRDILDTTVRQLYEQKGYVRLAFPKLEAAPAKNVDGIAVTATVEEGPVYKLGSVSAVGLDEAKTLLKDAKFRSGEVANFAEINGSVETVLSSLRKNGYIQAAVKTERHINDQDRTVDLTLHITPGPQFTMGTLTIKGLDIQTEPHVRKLWAIREGKPFNGEYPEFFLRRLREDGVFENLGKTRSSVKIDEEARRADVTLEFGRGTDLPQAGPDAEQERGRRF